MKWLWSGYNKARKKMKVENISTPMPKKRSKVSVKLDLVVEHPYSSTGFSEIYDSTVQFVLTEHSDVIECNLTHLDILS